MRWHILRTLLHKEALRHLANRGGIALVLLLLVASMLLSFFGTRAGPGGNAASLTPSVQLCYIDYAEDGPLVAHLRQNVPPELTRHVKFRHLSNARTDRDGNIVYPQNIGAIQLRPPTLPGAQVKVWIWHPGDDSTSMQPFELWFWKESLRFVQASQGPDGGRSAFEEQRSSLAGGMDPRSGLATALCWFGVFFVCVYLLPSLTCEERERGVLLAQALSPASTTELLAARFIFYPAVGLLLAAAMASTYDFRVLFRPFFWLALLSIVFGSMGIGLTIASLAKTQRAASMAAMSYMMAVALILFICQANGIPGLSHLAIEYHGPRMLHAALTDSVLWYHWMHLIGAAVLAVCWALVAARMFRRQGWQ